MTEQVAVTPGSAPSQGLLARVIGVFVSPRATYAGVAAHPRILGVLALTILVPAIVWFVFLSTQVGQDAMYEQQISAMESFGFQLPDEAYDQMEAGLAQARYFTAASQLIAGPVITAIVSGLILAVFSAMMGGTATFKQVYAIVAHAGVIPVLQSLFMVPLNYVRQTMSSPTTLRAFAPMIDESSFMGRLLGGLDLFWIWWMVSLSIGIGVLYNRRTGPIAGSLLTLYFVIVVLIAAVFSSLGGN